MNKKKTEGKVWVRIIIVLLILVLILCGTGYGVFHYYYGMLNHVSNNQAGTVQAENESDTEVDEEQKVREQLEANKEDIMYNDNIFNILLIGTDGRKGGTTGRSDAIMLLSINKETQDITLTSVMRDIYTSIEGYNSNRINAAYALGGTQLLESTIEQNFGVSVDRYVQVSFFSFIEVVDAVGGVDIKISKDEVPMLNAYVESLAKENGADKNLLTVDDTFESGIVHLDGVQSLAYTRIRYVGNGDFERTERQRTVLSALVDSAKHMNLLQLNSLLSTVLPLITTDLTEGETFSFLLNSSNYLSYAFDTYRLPIEGTYENVSIGGKSVLQIDFAANREALQQKIYGLTVEESSEGSSEISTQFIQ